MGMFDECLPVVEDIRLTSDKMKKKEKLEKANQVIERLMKDAEDRRQRKVAKAQEEQRPRRKSRERYSLKKPNQFSARPSGKKTSN